MSDDDFAFKIIICFCCAALISVGIFLGYNIWESPTIQNCKVIIDGKVYESSTLPKIKANKIIKFKYSKREVKIPFEKEIIITFN